MKIEDSAVELIAARYTREAGVRQLERNLGSVARKVALRIAQAQAETVNVAAATFASIWDRRVSIPKKRARSCRCRDRNGVDGDGRRSLFIEADAASGWPG